MSGNRVSRTVVIIAIVAAIAGATWLGASALIRTAVIVTYDAQPFVCVGDQAGISDLNPDDEAGDLNGEFLHTIQMTADLDCTLRHWVINDASLPITLTGVSYPLLGDSGVGVTASHVNGFEVARSGNEYDNPAAGVMFPVSITLEPGQRHLLLATLRHNPRGCASPTSIQWFSGAPTVQVTALGIPGERHPEASPYGFVGTEDSSCDDSEPTDD